MSPKFFQNIIEALLYIVEYRAHAGKAMADMQRFSRCIRTLSKGMVEMELRMDVIIENNASGCDS